MSELMRLSHTLGERLLLSEQRLVLAESCTGGMVAMAVTAVSGSSKWFDRGFITYSNASKTELLSVPESMIHESGAVSQEVARAMALGALSNSSAQISASITGIAGPEGGSIEKPVGMVCFGFGLCPAVLDQAHVVSETSYFKGDRQQIRIQATAFALQKLIELLQSQR